MSGSSSSPTNTTATTTNAKETNNAATNTSGVTILGNKGNVALTSVSTDQGAVAAGVGVAQAAVAANTGLAGTIATCGFNFANHAIDVLSDEQTASATLASNFLAQGSALLNQSESGLISIAAANEQAQNEQLANTSETLANIAQANDTSIQSQSTQFANKVLIIAAIAAVAIVLIVSRK